MKTVTLSVLLAAGLALAGAASAQESPTTPAAPAAPSYVPTFNSAPNTPNWDGDGWRHLQAPGSNIDPSVGVEALRDMDYLRAEEIFAGFLRYAPKNADANLYMGVAKMNLGKWDEARTHLEIAARNNPRHPDPKSRLGVTYARLGDAAAASAQRAKLAKMSESCRSSCKLSPYIAGGIEMIDEALAEPPVPGSGRG